MSALTESEARYLKRVETVTSVIRAALGGSVQECRRIAANVIRELDKVDADVS